MKVLQAGLLLVLAASIGIRLWGLMPEEQTEVFTVYGNVIDGASGEPLVGVRVLVVDSNTVCMTGESGSYRVSCKIGTHDLKFLMEGYENLDEPVTVKEEDMTVNVVLKPLGLPPQPPSSQTAIITGKVTNAKTGNPVVGATVGTENRRAITGSDGVYSLNVALGTYNLAVSVKGYEMKTVSVNVSEKKTYSVDIPLSAVPDMKVTASPDLIFTREPNRESTIAAVVVKEDGTPAVGVEVSFTIRVDSFVMGKLDAQTAVTDEKGVAKVVWTCKGENSVEDLNVINAMRLSYWTRITASCTVEGRSISDTTALVIQKEACHRSC